MRDIIYGDHVCAVLEVLLKTQGVLVRDDLIPGGLDQQRLQSNVFREFTFIHMERDQESHRPVKNRGLAVVKIESGLVRGDQDQTVRFFRDDIGVVQST